MRNNWSKGYVADLTYSHGYYHELSPSFMRFFLLLNGYANASQGGNFNYCELGFGQGVSANLHAAALPRGRFFGTDFNPDHALFAQNLSSEAGVEADWVALGFEEMLDADLPQFDFITLHGVWSWIDSAARHAVVEFIRRRLKVGGVVYLSYNIMPGWSAEKPLRDLLWLHTEHAGAAGGSTVARIRGALAFAEQLRQSKAGYFEQNSKASQMLDDMLRDDIHVVAHEYFNRSWFLTYFADLAQSLEAAGLGFACSLHRSDLVGEVQARLRASQIAEADLSPALRETASDFILNRRFRRDVFVRGALRLAPTERAALLRDVSLVLMRPASSISPTQQTPYGSVTLDAALTRRIVRALEVANAPMTMGEVFDKADVNAASAETAFDIVGALVAQSHLSVSFADDAQHAPNSRATQMNLAISRRARHENTLRYVVSPVTGQAVEASRFERLFLGAWQAGARTAAELVAAVGPDVDAIAAAEAAGSPPEESRRELETRAAGFVETVAPLWLRLGILGAEATR
ncbi:MAG TPA: class I SAM-dependent methyltransferase [Ramlibacter sp.]|nr:class I SAM-dependent methyltransferase [Ramlibacter sp.]